MLQVEKKMVRDGDDFEQRFLPGQAAGFDTGIDPVPLAQFEQVPDEFRMKKRLSSGSRDAPPRTVIKHLVAPDGVPYLLDRFLFSVTDKRSVAAGIQAVPAGGAKGIIDAVDAFARADGPISTAVGALAAICAEGFNETDLWLRGQAFRVRAPAAGQRAPFEEDDCSDSRAVMDGKSLDICYHRLARGCCFTGSCHYATFETVREEPD